MPDREIFIGTNTKPAHGLFIEWLNRLLNNYVSSFYDDAIKNIIMLSFIREHNSFMLEMYGTDGKEPTCFMTILPSDTTSPLLMIHNMANGEPMFWNSENSADAFEFDDKGRLVRFFENVSLPLRSNQGGTDDMECFITFETHYGIKAPMFIISDKGNESIWGKGWLDVPFEGKFSSAYLVQNKPLENNATYTMTNISKMRVEIDLPMLPNLNVKHKLDSGQSVLVPITELSQSFMNNSKNSGNLRFTKTPIL